MSGIFGHLNISDTDRVFSSTVGQQVIYTAVQDYIARVNADMAAAMSVFVERTTSDFKLRYKLPGGGHLQRRGPDGRYGAVKAYGSWDCSLPLEDFGAQIASNDVDRAYMTVAELDRHVTTIANQGVNTKRFELLKALLDNGADTFIDPLHDSLTIYPLANGDSVVYPPVIGSETDAIEDHYLESGYAASAISDSNNPYETIRLDLAHHNAGANVAVFVHTDQMPKTEDLADYDSVQDPNVRPGQDTDIPTNIPTNLPGVVRGRTNHVWVVEWAYLPTGYMVGVDLNAPKPLMIRIDPADTGLGEGLQLVATDEQYPFTGSFWRDRFGMGCGNRLNGVVMELGVGGTYTVPPAYD